MTLPIDLPLSNLLETARQAAQRAGEEILWRYALPRQIREKGPRDLVTDTDHAAEAAALSVIHTRHPNHRVLSEEDPASHFAEDGLWQIPPGLLWVVDPLDGTTNFATGIPFSCVSVGVSFNGLPVAGAIYDPYRDEMFAAAQGLGATLNGQAIILQQAISLHKSIISLDWAHAPQVRQRALTAIAALAPHCQTARALGSAALALAYVACGRIQLYFSFGLQPWDVGAAAILISEAGGAIRQPNGDAWRFGEPALLAGHPKLLEEAIPLVRATWE
jgi:myo-inositol-1(or 4)-monophosphatase